MPDVQCQICFAFEILDATLQDFAAMSAEDHSDLTDACTSLLFGSEQAAVEALLGSASANPSVPVSSRGMPDLADCWSRVLALVEDYNALGTGLELVPESSAASPTPRPHCAEWLVVDNVVVLVLNWGLALTHDGRTDPVYNVSEAADVSGQVMAMGHVAIRVPIEPAP
jgi:hypothetical protein